MSIVTKAKTCAFCGSAGKLTGEHVFGDWVTRIGLSRDPAQHGAGPLNRSLRDLGVTPPFQRTVRHVCGPCNNGWMSGLEAVAAKVLSPLILGKSGSIPGADLPAIATWVHKTALVAMLMSSEEDRAGGYGLPEIEYRELYAHRERVMPPPQTQFWLGRYEGGRLLSDVCVTPIVINIDGLPEPELPQAYVMTVLLGKVLLQGVRFTRPMLSFDVKHGQRFPQLWPTLNEVAWPVGDSVDDEAYPKVTKGLNLVAGESSLALKPWKSATDLPRSVTDGSMVRLPALCGKHIVCYPEILIEAARRGNFYAFVRSCPCGKTYLVRTEPNAATFKAEGKKPVVEALYDAIQGEEFGIRVDAEEFVCKQLSR